MGMWKQHSAFCLTTINVHDSLPGFVSRQQYDIQLKQTFWAAQDVIEYT